MLSLHARITVLQTSPSLDSFAFTANAHCKAEVCRTRQQTIFSSSLRALAASSQIPVSLMKKLRPEHTCLPASRLSDGPYIQAVSPPSTRNIQSVVPPEQGFRGSFLSMLFFKSVKGDLPH